MARREVLEKVALWSIAATALALVIFFVWRRLDQARSPRENLRLGNPSKGDTKCTQIYNHSEGCWTVELTVRYGEGRWSNGDCDSSSPATDLPFGQALQIKVDPHQTITIWWISGGGTGGTPGTASQYNTQIHIAIIDQFGSCNTYEGYWWDDPTSAYGYIKISIGPSGLKTLNINVPDSGDFTLNLPCWAVGEGVVDCDSSKGKNQNYSNCQTSLCNNIGNNIGKTKPR